MGSFEGQTGNKHRRTQTQKRDILMVDQLWLWIINSGEFKEPEAPNTIITSFPTRIGSDTRFDDDILDDPDRLPCRNTAELVSLILAGCCRTLSPSQDGRSINVVEASENAVGHVVSQLQQQPRSLSLLTHFQVGRK